MAGRRPSRPWIRRPSLNRIGQGSTRKQQACRHRNTDMAWAESVPAICLREVWMFHSVKSLSTYRTGLSIKLHQTCVHVVLDRPSIPWSSFSFLRFVGHISFHLSTVNPELVPAPIMDDMGACPGILVGRLFFDVITHTVMQYKMWKSSTVRQQRVQRLGHCCKRLQQKFAKNVPPHLRVYELSVCVSQLRKKMKHSTRSRLTGNSAAVAQSFDAFIEVRRKATKATETTLLPQRAFWQTTAMTSHNAIEYATRGSKYESFPANTMSKLLSTWCVCSNSQAQNRTKRYSLVLLFWAYFRFGMQEDRWRHDSVRQRSAQWGQTRAENSLLRHRWGGNLKTKLQAKLVLELGVRIPFSEKVGLTLEVRLRNWEYSSICLPFPEKAPFNRGCSLLSRDRRRQGIHNASHNRLGCSVDVEADLKIDFACLHEHCGQQGSFKQSAFTGHLTQESFGCLDSHRSTLVLERSSHHGKRTSSNLQKFI